MIVSRKSPKTIQLKIGFGKERNGPYVATELYSKRAAQGKSQTEALCGLMEEVGLYYSTIWNLKK